MTRPQIRTECQTCGGWTNFTGRTKVFDGLTYAITYCPRCRVDIPYWSHDTEQLRGMKNVLLPSDLHTYRIPELGVTIDAPPGLAVNADTVYEEWAILTGPGFELRINAFVPERSSHSAEETKNHILALNEGAIKFTYEEDHGRTWRIDYELANGLAGTSMRVDAFVDCGIGGVTPAQRDLVAALCTTIRRI